MTDDKTKDHPSFIDAITEELLEKYEPAQAVAVLSSIIINIYNKSNKDSAFILAEPNSKVAVVTTSVDALHALPEVLEKTFQGLQELKEELDPDEKPNETPPNTTLH